MTRPFRPLPLQEYRLVKNISLVMNKSFWVVQQEKRRRRRNAADQPTSVEVELLPGYKRPTAKPTHNPQAMIIPSKILESEVDEDFSEVDAATESDVEFGAPQEARPQACTYVQKERNGIQSSTSSCEEKKQVICSTTITGQEHALHNAHAHLPVAPAQANLGMLTSL